ncbi:MAG: protein kinase, partial [Gemmatimonadota bacterium]
MTSPGTTPPARLTAALADRYRIEREVGAGGMATVYLAEDLRHHRKVAIKVVHPELAAVIGPERFLQEIELTASLQHPHILPLFDSGNADGVLYYVMPYVEGETLRARLAREHQLPVSDAVRIAREVADALDYAHKRNVVHRDIKPENILLQNGRPLVADFGIALAVQHAGGARMTQTGMSLGTPQYMAPEQAMGDRSVDARADIYALGVVTYEMLAGAPPFVAASAQAVVAKVMTEDPLPLIPQRRSVPPEVEDAVLTALEKLPADRFATAADFAAALTAPAPRRSRAPVARARPPVLLLLVVALAALAAGWLLHGAGRAPVAPRAARRAVIPLSPEFVSRESYVATSADGSTLVVTDAERIRLRRLDRLDLAQVPGSADGAAPFLSDDGRRIGFTRSGHAVVQGIDGSDQVTLSGSAAEGAFLDDDRIVVADSAGLALVHIRTGARSVIAAAPAGRRFLQPAELPGGRAVLVSLLATEIGDARAAVVDLASHRIDTLALGPALAPRYSAGLLYFARPSGALMAVPFDAAGARVVGTPEALGDFAVLARFGHVNYAVGAGMIAYGARSSNRIVAIGSGDRKTVLTPGWGNYHNPRVSPDGTRILVDREEADIVGRDVWILDLRTSTFTRATSVGDAHDAVWAPDGRHVTYLSFSTPGGPIVTAPADGGSGTEKIATNGAVNPGTWMPDGSAYLAGVIGPRSSDSDILALHRDGRGIDTLIATQYDEHSPAMSRDGRWLAYISDETGTKQVYVRPLRGGGRTLVSDAAGEEPVWGPDGRLFYIEHRGEKSRVRAVRLGVGESPVVIGRSTEVEDLVYQPVGNHANWDILPDGRKVFVEPGAGSELVLVFDWAPA